MAEILFKEESYKLIGLCMEVHRILGKGFKEVVYKDALEIELKKANITFEREKRFQIEYKGIILPHQYFSDFVINGVIILEVKAVSTITDGFVTQTINYLKASNIKLGIIVNFGEASLTHKRVVF